jgi:heme exporter protein D
MELGPHAGFIIAGYLVSAIVIVGGIWLSLMQARKVRARLGELEARGIRRRSDKRPAPTAAPEIKA